MTPQRFTTFKKPNANCLCNKVNFFPFLDLVFLSWLEYPKRRYTAVLLRVWSVLCHVYRFGDLSRKRRLFDRTK